MRSVGGGGGSRAVPGDTGLMEDYITDGALVLFPKALLSADMARIDFAFSNFLNLYVVISFTEMHHTRQTGLRGVFLRVLMREPCPS